MAKVILKGYIEVCERDLAVVTGELANHVRLTRAETGCVVFEVIQNKEVGNRFDVYEEFSDERAFENHQTRVKNSKWGEITRSAVRNYVIIRHGEEYPGAINPVD